MMMGIILKYTITVKFLIGINNTISDSFYGCLITMDITYDDNDYPISSVVTGSCNSSTQTYTYEYNNLL